MIATREIGPRLQTAAPDFCVLNHKNRAVSLDELMGNRGLALGFTGDIWQPASVRRVLWFQHHYAQLQKLEVNMALLICDKPHVLYGFSMSSLTPVEFPLLSDIDHTVHMLYNMCGYAGLVVMDNTFSLRDKWIMPDERVWPKPHELMTVLKML